MPLPLKKQYKLSIVLLVISCLIILPTQVLLTSGQTPTGIADLEMAGTPEKFQWILNLWGDELLWAVYASIWMDFLFLVGYTLLFHAMTRSVLDKLQTLDDLSSMGQSLVRTGFMVKKAFITAGLADIIENICMLLALQDVTASIWITCTTLFASIKFLALFYGLIFLFFGRIYASLQRSKLKT